jgi:Tfp pilus assembly PilM family ATPase
MMFPSTVRSGERDGAIRAMGRPLGTTFGLEQSTLATYLAGTTTGADGVSMATVGVAAALSDDVEAIKTVCDLAKCSPLAIDLSGAAILRALTRVNPAAGEVGTIVDVGATKVMVATRQGMYLRSLRVTVGAGDEVTRSLATAMRASFDEAEQQKPSMRLTSAANEVVAGYGTDDDLMAQSARRSPVDTAFSSSVDMLVDAIAQSVEADASNFNSMSQGVTLCGGTALLRGFKDRLQQRLGIPVSIARPWAEIERSRRNAAFFSDGRPDPRLLLSLSVAVGLSLWKEPL